MFTVNFVEQWPLMNPNELLFILASYLLFVLKIGPILMEGRPPVQIKGFLIFYNLFKVINSAVLTYTVIVKSGLSTHKKIICCLDQIIQRCKGRENQLFIFHIGVDIYLTKYEKDFPTSMNQPRTVPIFNLEQHQHINMGHLWNISL